jgi:hypothetical protein
MIIKNKKDIRVQGVRGLEIMNSNLIINILKQNHS